MSMRSLLCSSALFLAIQISSAVRQDVKIVVGKKINRDDKAQSSSSSTTSSTPTQPTPSRDPAAFDSSDVFSGIFGQCFEKEQGDYVYTFCPLKNFTQKNLPSHYSPNTYILGIWGTWTEGDKDIHPEYSYLHLNDGTECTPSLKRSISIYVECIPYEELVAPAQQAVPTATSTQTTGDSASSSATADILVPGTDPPSSSPEQGTPSIETPTETRTCAEDDNTCHADSTGNSGALDTSNTRNNDNSVTLNSVKSTEPSPCQYEAYFASTFVSCDVYPPKEEREARKAAAAEAALIAARKAAEAAEEEANAEESEVIRKLRQELGRVQEELLECRSKQ